MPDGLSLDKSLEILIDRVGRLTKIQQDAVVKARTLLFEKKPVPPVLIERLGKLAQRMQFGRDPAEEE